MVTDEALIEERDAAWVEWADWEHNEYYPRWYKQHSKWINPWITMDELREAQARRKALFRRWLGLNFECLDRGLPSMEKELWERWSEITTPNGRRYIRNHA